MTKKKLLIILLKNMRVKMVYLKDYEALCEFLTTNALIPLVLFLARARQKYSREKLQHLAPNIDDALFIKRCRDT